MLKALSSVSIAEPPVPVFLNGEEQGVFHGLEVFERVQGCPAFPQTLADLVANAYLRLSYQKNDGTSATFGSSIVGCPSFRTEDGALHFIPRVRRANVFIGNPTRMRIEISGHYGDLAEVVLRRDYHTEAQENETRMSLWWEIRFRKEVTLDSRLAGLDRFRLLTISSMFSTSTRFDANCLSWSDEGNGSVFQLEDATPRDSYLLKNRASASAFSVQKEMGSQGERNTPGSPDSPSISATFISSSRSSMKTGLQGFLTGSTAVNDDSLSVWLEWLNAPERFREGESVSAELEILAHPPNPISNTEEPQA